MTKKTTKRSLAMSILSLVLCLAMLIGSTYAWFSDEAKTDAVTITAGNLDVELVAAKKSEDGSKYVEDETKQLTGEGAQPLFDTTKLDMENWEPGMMMVSEPFMIKNAGTLTLQYKLDVKKSLPAAVEADEETVELLSRINYKVAKAESWNDLAANSTIEDRRNAWKALVGADELTKGVIYPAEGKGVTAPEEATKGATEALVIVLFWNPNDSTALSNIDNLYNNQKNKKFSVQFSVNLFATQTPAEQDSFGDKYDDLQIPDSEKVTNTLEKGKTLTVSESKKTSSTSNFKGEGTVSLGSNVELQYNGAFSQYSTKIGNTKDKSDITLSGSGKILKPKNTSSSQDELFAVEIVGSQTTVTVEGGTYEGFLLRTKGSKLVINGGTITGLVNVIDAARDTNCITINDGEAVKDAEFMQNDTQWIKIPDTGYKWSDPVNGRVKLVAA